eukprot:15230138-Alexandrium_andersonii.AAC.1
MPSCGYEPRGGFEQRFAHPIEDRYRVHIARDSVNIFAVLAPEFRDIVFLRRRRVRRQRRTAP